MSTVTELMIGWFAARQGRVTYSMESRNGPYSYDCSSSVYSAMIYAGLRPVGSWLGNTESMFRDLPAAGWYELPYDPVTGFDAQRGDVFIWGRQGSSIGAAGHTGMFVDPANIIHCNYGYNGITVNNHDAIWSANGSPVCAVYRYKGNTPAVPSVPANNTKPAAPAVDPLEEIMSWYPNKAAFEAAQYEAAKRAVVENVRYAKFLGFGGSVQDVQTVIRWSLKTIMDRVDPARKIKQYGRVKGKDLGADPKAQTTDDLEVGYNSANVAANVERLDRLEEGQAEILKLLKGGAK